MIYLRINEFLEQQFWFLRILPNKNIHIAASKLIQTANHGHKLIFNLSGSVFDVLLNVLMLGIAWDFLFQYRRPWAFRFNRNLSLSQFNAYRYIKLKHTQGENQPRNNCKNYRGDVGSSDYLKNHKNRFQCNRYEPVSIAPSCPHVQCDSIFVPIIMIQSDVYGRNEFRRLAINSGAQKANFILELFYCEEFAIQSNGEEWQRSQAMSRVIIL